MKKILLFISILAIAATVAAQATGKDEKEILAVLAEQNKQWNAGNVEAFMQGYWNNDSLMFIGKSGVTYGWKNTLENYKTNYPDTAAMGQLTFNIIEVKRLSVLYFHVVGKWHLTRSIGNAEGHFTLLFKKIKNKWLIIKDHSS